MKSKAEHKQRKSFNENIRKIDSLKSVNQELEAQVNLLHESLQKKEKEIHKIIFEKEGHIKLEEEYKRALKEMKSKEEDYTKKIFDLKNSNEMLEQDCPEAYVQIEKHKVMIILEKINYSTYNKIKQYGLFRIIQEDYRSKISIKAAE